MTNEPSTPTGPPISWVIKRDGRKVPFEADKISSSLFAASEEQGDADPFLCRELTDGVLHFLRHENNDKEPTTASIAELVVKIVRELGHPALAGEYQVGREKSSRRRVLQIAQAAGRRSESLANSIGECLALEPHQSIEYYENEIAALLALHAVYEPDIRAAQADQLIHLGSPQSYRRLVAAVVPFQVDPFSLAERLSTYRRVTGEAVVLDLPGGASGKTGSWASTEPDSFQRSLALGLDESGCSVILNLNRRLDSAGESSSDIGSLFGASASSDADALSGESALSVLSDLNKRPPGAIRIDWHINENDFTENNSKHTAEPVRLAVSGLPVSFVFDRPRRPARIVEGLSLGKSAILAGVGLNLLQLARQMGAPRTPERFLTKLVSLVRLALSAATQKRTYLRSLKEKSPFLAQGFFLEKARVVLTPIGLDQAVADLTGDDCCSRSPEPLSFGCQILEKIRTTAQSDGRALLMDVVVDSPLTDGQFRSNILLPSEANWNKYPAGVTVCDSDTPLERQISVCSALHAAAKGGTALIPIDRLADDSDDHLIAALRYAWEKTELLAMRLIREKCQSEGFSGQAAGQ
jgi:hypothetical protein